MSDAPPAGSSSNRPSTPSDAPPLTPADPAIVSAAYSAAEREMLRQYRASDWETATEMAESLDLGKIVAAWLRTLPGGFQVPEGPCRTYSAASGMFAALARLAEAGNE